MSSDLILANLLPGFEVFRSIDLGYLQCAPSTSAPGQWFVAAWFLHSEEAQRAVHAYSAHGHCMVSLPIKKEAA